MSGSIGGGWQSRGSPSQMSEQPSGQRSVLGGHNQRRASRLPHLALDLAGKRQCPEHVSIVIARSTASGEYLSFRVHERFCDDDGQDKVGRCALHRPSANVLCYGPGDLTSVVHGVIVKRAEIDREIVVSGTPLPAPDF